MHLITSHSRLLMLLCAGLLVACRHGDGAAPDDGLTQGDGAIANEDATNSPDGDLGPDATDAENLLDADGDGDAANNPDGDLGADSADTASPDAGDDAAYDDGSAVTAAQTASPRRGRARAYSGRDLTRTRHIASSALSPAQPSAAPCRAVEAR